MSETSDGKTPAIDAITELMGTLPCLFDSLHRLHDVDDFSTSQMVIVGNVLKAGESLRQAVFLISEVLKK